MYSLFASNASLVHAHKASASEGEKIGFDAVNNSSSVWSGFGTRPTAKVDKGSHCKHSNSAPPLPTSSPGPRRRNTIGNELGISYYATFTHAHPHTHTDTYSHTHSTHQHTDIHYTHIHTLPILTHMYSSLGAADVWVMSLCLSLYCTYTHRYADTHCSLHSWHIWLA